jgi:hypothetical protein
MGYIFAKKKNTCLALNARYTSTRKYMEMQELHSRELLTAVITLAYKSFCFYEDNIRTVRLPSGCDPHSCEFSPRYVDISLVFF